jgi:hypothetical protein
MTTEELDGLQVGSCVVDKWSGTIVYMIIGIEKSLSIYSYLGPEDSRIYDIQFIYGEFEHEHDARSVYPNRRVNDSYLLGFTWTTL